MNVILGTPYRNRFELLAQRVSVRHQHQIKDNISTSCSQKDLGLSVTAAFAFASNYGNSKSRSLATDFPNDFISADIFRQRPMPTNFQKRASKGEHF